jgi:glycosyltransferase involved in cell wall biosynthesis
LTSSIKQLGSFKPPVIVAINESHHFYNYDRSVKFGIRRDFQNDYEKAAKYLNSSKVQLINLQHEFGLFGGEWGEYITTFLKEVEKPIVTTLHTLSPSFEAKTISILQDIAQYSSKLITMTQTGKDILKKYDIQSDKIEIIQHGCPDIPFVDPQKIKSSLFGSKIKIVLSTFGLLSRGKGIEYVIKALPEVVKKNPELVYLIIGQTHPEVRRIEGEKYRNKLIQLTEDLELHENVKFHNRFLTRKELIKYLKATDIYITPYVDPNQISSGTLVYAMGAGKAIISTPYLHAKEALAQNRGLLCKFKDSKSISKNISQLANNPKLRRSLQKRTYKYSRNFTWKKVAEKYVTLFRSLIRE